MSDKEKSQGKRLSEIAEALSEQDKDLLLAYGQGLADMARRLMPLSVNQKPPAERPGA